MCNQTQHTSPPFVNPQTFLGQTIRINIDRPMGSRHPTEGFIYPLNYGYIPHQPAPDGDDLDAYLLGVFDPVDSFEGSCIAIIHRTNDHDDKLVLAPEGKFYTDEQIMALVEFQERFFDSVILR